MCARARKLFYVVCTLCDYVLGARQQGGAATETSRRMTYNLDARACASEHTHPHTHLVAVKGDADDGEDAHHEHEEQEGVADRRYRFLVHVCACEGEEEGSKLLL